jgi:hypothetical protein
MLYDAFCDSSIHLSLRLEEPPSAAPNKVGRSMNRTAHAFSILALSVKFILEVVAGFVNCVRILFSYLVDKVYLFDLSMFVRSEVGDGENATHS